MSTVSEAARSAPTDRTRRYSIEPVDPAGFSALRLAELRHDYHLHPLMQLGSLRRLAKALLPIGKCRFLPPGATQRSEFATAERSFDGRDAGSVHDVGPGVSDLSAAHGTGG